MKKQNKRHSAHSQRSPKFNPKKSSFQAALSEHEPSIQEMRAIILLAELVKSLEKHHGKQ